jgi:hypothetical protein
MLRVKLRIQASYAAAGDRRRCRERREGRSGFRHELCSRHEHVDEHTLFPMYLQYISTYNSVIEDADLWFWQLLWQLAIFC